jgi:ABC-type multidrug transport system ATPase subunit
MTAQANVLGSFEGITKTFGSHKALDGLDFKIYRGVNGLIGPNGAGKTTTIKLILGLIKANTGQVEMFGFDCWQQSQEVRCKIGILYEKIAFYEHLSGFEHLKFMAKIKGVTDPAAESKEMLKLVELDGEAQNKRIGTYSAGMKQRIGLAHALLGKPALVILDEPTSNLDPLGREHIIRLVNELKKEGYSFLISSHILPELEKVCEHIVLMNKGRAVRQGLLNELLGDISPQTFAIKVQPFTPLFELLKKEACVKEVTLNNGTLIVDTKDHCAFKQRLPSLVSEAHVSLEEVKTGRKDLDALFRLAVEEA